MTEVPKINQKKDRNESRDKILRQNEVIISLLGRIAFTEKEIGEIVKKKKRNPEKYVEAYNACDGQHKVSQVAKIAGVGQPTMTEVLKLWEEVGIIYEVEKTGGKFYKKLFQI